MEDELEHFLNVRDTVLASDSASPDQLKAHDRQLYGGQDDVRWWHPGSAR